MCFAGEGSEIWVFSIGNNADSRNRELLSRRDSEGSKTSSRAASWSPVLRIATYSGARLALITWKNLYSMAEETNRRCQYYVGFNEVPVPSIKKESCPGPIRRNVQLRVPFRFGTASYVDRCKLPLSTP
eukprot:gb/GECG01009255.1/.p1 GENE.gb/GECG01009255.1/~~gb/GECG01009255.1/.p1  ORF type:complete len:129 (+),score=7.50 gb/GECG01009255.1/:1-387(+)